MSRRMIVSDIGGTNGRFAVAEFSGENDFPDISNIQVFPCKDYPTFADMFAAYFTQFGDDAPKTAHFAVAGEMHPEYGNLWHFNWDISAVEIEKKFNLSRVTLLNDYEALVQAVPFFSKDDLKTITKNKTSLHNAPFSVFGVGSGLGGSIGVPCSTGLQVVPTEIGHISFAPKSKLEQDLLNYTKKSIEHVSIETFLSGPGIKCIHQFIVEGSGGDNQTMFPSEITTAAKDGNIESCVKAVDLFLSILASTTGDIALSQGAKGGIYIGGGVIPKIADLIDQDAFYNRYIDKGPMRDYVKKIPVSIITSDMPALIGAALAPSR